MKKFMEEFKAFIARGNVMDMAVGIIIGGAFTSIVTSLVEDIINPLLGLFGGMNFDRLHVKLLGEVTLNYGKFITAVVNFLIMAFIVFLLMKVVNGMGDKITGKEAEGIPTTALYRQHLYRAGSQNSIGLVFLRKSKACCYKEYSGN